jgi:regulator of sirC expression with transglutaminase-like and TPR domain
VESKPESAPEEPNAALTSTRASGAPTEPDPADLDRRQAPAAGTGRVSTARGDRQRLEALIDLLGDESKAVYESVWEELVRAGRAADPVLQRATRSPRARVRARARRVLQARARGGVMRRLLGYAAREEVDLERALFLLGRLDRPDLDTRPYRKALDAMAAEVSRRAAREEDTFARPMVLSHYLGNELGFVGSETDFTHPDNVHLHRTIERKQGMPLSLVAIYLFVARRAGLKAAPIALPGRVLLRLYAGRRTMLIDPFQGGRARTRMDCIRYLSEHGLVPRPDWFHDASDRALFQRHTLNLMSSCQMRGREREARELHRLAVEIGRVAEREDAD